MDNYIEYVEECREKQLPDVIENSSLVHAKVIVESLILFATEHKKPIYIISGSLYENFWNPMISGLEKYFKEVGKKAYVELVVINAFDPKLVLKDNAVYQLLKSFESTKQSVIHEGIRKSIVANQAHFILVGNQAYRREKGQNRAVATACFNDPRKGEWLHETFNFVTNYIKNPSLLAHQAT